ncbi:VOC family protein [Arthrobacter echini]|uniref:VOC family protein n=1 Tax=Arthrobacter echini TaxID=1529066 RepID=A0A5D0XJZ7_9MICC|nr:VOC family protein [Arthrobacter echini]TYC96845.1 VOC family protein [Arthrobacter echini]
MTMTDERFINPATSMGAVTLRVGDLEAMSAYYSGAFAMEPVQDRAVGREVHRVLGRGEVPLVRLIHTPDLPAGDRHQAGLFHTAFLFDNPSSLAATVYRAANAAKGRFVGSSDHLVSEAFYFTDPEGNGVELYTDRPRDQWTHDEGQIRMTTAYLDPNNYLESHLDQASLDAGPSLPGTVGHVHLQVGDLTTARSFYIDALGFEITQTEYAGALFASAGGYHHHIAMNTWNSQGAGPRAARLGLGSLAVTVPGQDDLDALQARLSARSLPFTGDSRIISVNDPWGTRVTVSVAGTTFDEVILQ